MRGQHSHQPANHSSPEDGHGVAEDDEAVVEQELVGAALAVVRDHVRRVVQEVTDGEADQAVAGHRVAPLQVRHHVRGLQRGSIGNGLPIDIYRLLISRFMYLYYQYLDLDLHYLTSMNSRKSLCLCQNFIQLRRYV